MDKWLKPENPSGGLDFSDSKGLSTYKGQSYDPVSSSGSAAKPSWTEQPLAQASSNRPASKPTQPQSQPQQQQAPPPTQLNEPKYKKLFKYTVVFLDVFFSFLVSSTGALGIKSARSINDSAQIFVALYLILFSGILLFHECMQVCKLHWLDLIIKKNVGFLYGPIGKGCYLIL